MNTPKAPVQERSRKRVALILESTLTVLREQGLLALTTNSIAAKADIPVSSIYQYYPDKKAILMAIYEDYLARIRSVYGQFDDPKYLQMPPERALEKIFRTILLAELDGGINAELEKALKIYPELAEIDRRHQALSADTIAGLMQSMGASWSKPKLRRLAQFLYSINAGIWSYRADIKPPKKEALEWELEVVRAMLHKAFEGKLGSGHAEKQKSDIIQYSGPTR